MGCGDAERHFVQDVNLNMIKLYIFLDFCTLY